ncbi:MAG: dienelactone hydrolase family protein [Bacteroidota bacterium]
MIKTLNIITYGCNDTNKIKRSDTGAASAIRGAVEKKEIIKAVVSRGGRPDMAEDALNKLNTPTLLIVGELDKTVIMLNENAIKKIPGEKKIEIVPNASHLFEEPGALDEVARLTADWFDHYLG